MSPLVGFKVALSCCVQNWIINSENAWPKLEGAIQAPVAFHLRSQIDAQANVSD